MAITYPNARKLSEEQTKSLSELKENAELEPNKYYIPAIKAGEENYKVPVTDFGKGGNNLINIGYIYHNDSYYQNGQLVHDPDINNNPLSDPYIEQFDEILAAGGVPFIMYASNSYLIGHYPSDSSWGTESPVDIPEEIKLDSECTHCKAGISHHDDAYRIAPLVRIQYCTYYFANPMDNGYVVKFHEGDNVLFVKNTSPATYYNYY